MADAPTNSKPGSSALSRSTSAARPKAQSWRKMYEPLACTASATCRMKRLDRGLAVGVNKAYLLPGLDLSISVNIRSIVICSSGRVDDGSLGYQKRSRDGRTLCVILHTDAGVNVVLGRSRPGHGCKDDTVREGQATNFERSEESRRLGGRRHLSLESSSSRRRVFELEVRAGWLESNVSTSHFLYSRGSKGIFLT